MDRKKQIEEALSKNLEGFELTDKDNDLLFELLNENFESRNFNQCYEIISRLEPPLLSLSASEIEIQASNKMYKKIQIVINRNMNKFLKKGNYDQIYIFYKTFNDEKIFFSLSETTLFIIDYFIKINKLQDILELFQYLISIDFMFYVSDVYLFCIKYAITNNKMRFYDEVFTLFLNWQKEQFELYLVVNIEEGILKLLVEYSRNADLVKYFRLPLEYNKKWYFYSSNAYIFNTNMDFTINVLKEFQKKFPKYKIQANVALFRDLVVIKKPAKANKILDNIRKSKLDFLNDLVTFYIIDQEEISVKFSIVDALIKNNSVKDLYIIQIISIFLSNNHSQILEADIQKLRILIDKLKEIFKKFENNCKELSSRNRKIINHFIKVIENLKKVIITTEDIELDELKKNIIEYSKEADIAVLSLWEKDEYKKSHKKSDVEKISMKIEILNILKYLVSNIFTSNKTIFQYYKNLLEILYCIESIFNKFIIEMNERRHSKEIIEREKRENTIRIQERNQIMSNLSHTVKNMISTIIDPLENLKTSNEIKPVTIDNAIRGANLIRNLVNAMNLSFQGSLEDFNYDVKHASYYESSSLEQLITESLKYSVSCMFDGKYFERFMRNYFPTKAEFITAKNKWNEVSQSFDLNKIKKFINEYMLDLKLDIVPASKLVIGDEKGSSLKLLILFQEVILNAIKYSSFVDKGKREVLIKIITKNEKVSFIVSNNFENNIAVKSSGLGKEIIKNFSYLLDTEPVFTKKENKCIVKIIFPNMWAKLY